MVFIPPEKPSSSVQRATEAATEAAIQAASAAAHATQASAAAATAAVEAAEAAAAQDPIIPEGVTAPPEVAADPLGQLPAALDGKRWWYARDYPQEFVEDGIYTLPALQRLNIPYERPAPTGLLQGWKTAPPALNKARESGVDHTVIWWR